MSLRQFEALTQKADIIACEDTRKTGKLLKLTLDKRMRAQFKNVFGADVETFFDADLNQPKSQKSDTTPLTQKDVGQETQNDP